MDQGHGPDTYRMLFTRQEYPGWRLSTRIPNLYRHPDGTLYAFVGVPAIDSIRRTKEGGVEVVILDSPRETV